MEITIKPMQKEDIDQVAEIEKAAYGEHHWSKDSFYEELSNKLAHYSCAIKSDGEIVGFSGIWHIIDEAHITNIAVNPKFKKQKIGETLLKNMIDECYKSMIKYITLEVRESNIPAIKLYEKYGFKSLGVRKNYYQDNNENALIMWTENIFWDKFKTMFNENTEKLKEVITQK